MAGTKQGSSKRDRGTWARGERCRHARLDAGKVTEIRELGERRERLRQELRGLTNEALAERYGVSVNAIANIIHGATWGHV